ncbi:YuzB family protein [Cytobacillus firmus]|nr:YuzB family protein [Cytobacillus firmus]
MIEVKFCPCNFDVELEPTKENLRKNCNLVVSDEKCLLYCGQCLIEPFVIINGKNIAAEDPDILYEGIIKYIKQLQITG